MTGQIRILLADDHALLRSGLKILLEAEPDFTVIGEATDGLEAWTLSSKLQPDVLVIDLTMPGGSGLDALAKIKMECPETKILILTMHDEEQYILRSLQEGADGYLLKSAADDELIAAIRIIQAGQPYLYPCATSVLLEQQRRGGAKQTSSIQANLADLSPRELQVLELIAYGYSSRQIAERLHLSPKTVETYRYRMMEKLNLSSRPQLVQYALRHGLLEEKRPED